MMKLPVSFKEFSKDPSKALMYLMVFAVVFLYIRMEKQDNSINTGCEVRLAKCETTLERMGRSLKTQDSLVASLVSEMNTYKKLGVIK